jgi:hypothetical protein
MHFAWRAVKESMHMPLLIINYIVVRVGEPATSFTAHFAQQCVEAVSSDTRVKGHRVDKPGIAFKTKDERKRETIRNDKNIVRYAKQISRRLSCISFNCTACKTSTHSSLRFSCEHSCGHCREAPKRTTCCHCSLHNNRKKGRR